MVRLTRALGAAALLVAGLVLPTGPAQAAACSGTTGVTVVIDYGSTSTTACAPNSSSAMSALRSVAQVDYPVQYPGTVVCRINGVPKDQPCQQMPPSSAYWAFHHAKRGGSWTYSSVGAADYAPPPGTVIGFAFGAGARPSSAPPAASATPKPTPSSPASRPSPVPTAVRPSTPRPSGSVAPRPRGTTSSSTSPSGTSASATTRPATSTTTTAPGTPTTSTSSTSSASQPGGDQTTTDTAGTTVAAAATGEDGSPVTLLAGLGLVGLVGAAAAYVALRRRADG